MFQHSSQRAEPGEFSFVCLENLRSTHCRELMRINPGRTSHDCRPSSLLSLLRLSRAWHRNRPARAWFEHFSHAHHACWKVATQRNANYDQVMGNGFGLRAARECVRVTRHHHYTSQKPTRRRNARVHYSPNALTECVALCTPSRAHVIMMWAETYAFVFYLSHVCTARARAHTQTLQTLQSHTNTQTHNSYVHLSLAD